MKDSRWKARRDWAGWSLGRFPRNEGGWHLTLQKINWYCINLDFGWGECNDWRVQVIYRQNGYAVALNGGPERRLSINNWAKP